MDRIAYQVVFNSAEQVGWVFSVCKKKDAKYLKQSYADLNFFGQNYDPSFMNERYTLLAESQELFIELFQNKTLLNYYKIIENTIDVIYCTDQETFCKE